MKPNRINELWDERDGKRTCIGYLTKCSAGGWSAYVRTSSGRYGSLLGIVTTILKDHDRATELLPTKDGFFFGSTHYDTWYFSDLENTKTILDEALANESGDFIYLASW